MDSKAAFKQEYDDFFPTTAGGSRQAPTDIEWVPLNALISGDQKKMFVENVFNNNENLFNQIILDLDITRSWNEAYLLIEKFFLKNRINLHTDASRSFRDFIHKRYFLSE